MFKRVQQTLKLAASDSCYLQHSTMKKINNIMQCVLKFFLDQATSISDISMAMLRGTFTEQNFPKLLQNAKTLNLTS